MKKLMFALLAFTACLAGRPIYADTGFYSGAHVGANYLHIEQASGIKNGYKGGLCVGYKFDNSIRVEGEFAHRRNAAKATGIFTMDTVLTTDSLMANVFYDFDFDPELNCQWTPYVGVGLGFGHNRSVVETETGGQYKSTNRYAYQVMAGANYKISDKTYVGLEYKYFSPEKSTHDHGMSAHVKRYF